jgi:hypothetical protein
MTVDTDDWTTRVRALVAESPGDLEGPVDRDRCWDFIRMVRDSWFEAIKKIQRELILAILLFAFSELIRSAQVQKLEFLGVEIRNLDFLARGVAVSFAGLYASVARGYVSIDTYRHTASVLQGLMGVRTRAGRLMLAHLNPTSSLLYINYKSLEGRSTKTAENFIQAAGTGVAAILVPTAAIVRMSWTLWTQTTHDGWLYVTYVAIAFLILMAMKDWLALILRRGPFGGGSQKISRQLATSGASSTTG